MNAHRRRRAWITGAVGAALLGAAPALPAQSVARFRDLALRLNIGDEIVAQRTDSTAIRGAITVLGRNAITVRGAQGLAVELQAGQAAQIRVSRSRARTGALVGFGVGALLTAITPCHGPECGEGVVFTGILTAGLGALLYPRESRVVFDASRRDVAARDTASYDPPGPLDSLANRIDLGDRVRLVDRAGNAVTGRVLQLSGASISLGDVGSARAFAAAEVRRVEARRWSSGRGALVGAGAFAAAALLSSPCRQNADCSPAWAAVGGAAVGAMIGTVIPRYVAVYRAP